jgi:two-component system sensor histidine kinase PilS (NtrC family)
MTALHAGREWRRLVRLMGARLALSFVIFLVALTLVGVREGAESADRGLYGTVAASFLAAALYAIGFRFVKSAVRFGAAQIATDVAILSSLVYFSGGKESLFTFLYVPIIVYAAQLFGRAGAYGSAGLVSMAYGILLAAIEQGLLPPPYDVALGAGVPWPALWLLHSGAWLLVALLSSALWRELDRHSIDLARLRRLHERTVESLTSGLLTTDRAGRITSFNAEAERITCVPGSDALGRFADVVIPGLAELLASPAAGEGGRARRRMPFAAPDGRDVFLGVAASVLRDEGADPAGHVVIFQDVTQVVDMEAELRRSERLAAVGELAAGMAHEVRNPLAAISGSIQMLHAGLPAHSAGGEQGRLMEIVLRETDRLDALIREFLRFARPAPTKPNVIDLSQEVEEVLQVFAGSCPGQIQVRRELQPGVRAWADRDQVHQLLWNLLRNAVQAMGDAGTLRVATRAAASPQERIPEDRKVPKGTSGEWTEISVEDTGPGIPAEVLDRIFEPFFTTRPDGSGLGLATVHRVVEANGGAMRVESRPGEGSVFRVLLPGAKEIE